MSPFEETDDVILQRDKRCHRTWQKAKSQPLRRMLRWRR